MSRNVRALRELGITVGRVLDRLSPHLEAFYRSSAQLHRSLTPYGGTVHAALSRAASPLRDPDTQEVLLGLRRHPRQRSCLPTASQETPFYASVVQVMVISFATEVLVPPMRGAVKMIILLGVSAVKLHQLTVRQLKVLWQRPHVNDGPLRKEGDRWAVLVVLRVGERVSQTFWRSCPQRLLQRTSSRTSRKPRWLSVR